MVNNYILCNIQFIKIISHYKNIGYNINALQQTACLVVNPITVGNFNWLSGRVLDSRPRGRGFEPHWRHCVVILEQDTFILAYYWFNPGRPVPV